MFILFDRVTQGKYDRADARTMLMRLMVELHSVSTEDARTMLMRLVTLSL